jgi:hypothetical protein
MIENGACPGESGGKACSSLRSACPTQGTHVKKRENQKAEIIQCPDAEWKICYQCGSEYDFHGSRIKCNARDAKSLDGMKISIYL